jgi:hypothetical protein
VHERAQERRHADIVKRRGDRRVIVGEGLAGMGIPHHLVLRGRWAGTKTI